MDFTEYTAVKNKFAAQPNLCDLFKLLAIETWKRIEYAYIKPGVKVFETTITQNLLFSLNAYRDQYGLDIDIFEARDEKRNGNDIELIIRYPEDRMEYYAPIQAKKVYRDGRYVSITHGAQIKTLQAYAKTRDAKALYLLYNYSPNLREKLKELSGCTLISADYLFDNYYKEDENKWKIPRFKDLHPDPAIPWHQLVCAGDIIELGDLVAKAGIASPILSRGAITATKFGDQIGRGFFSIGSYSGDNNNWINIRELSVQSEEAGHKQREKYFSDSTLLKDSKQGERVYREFAPKSRIVITKKIDTKTN